jgi:glycosyltransferase involved in cell wall biosynthesis
MHLVIDARMISDQMHGIARYTYNLIDLFAQIRNGNEYTVLVNHNYLDNFVKNKQNFELKLMKSKFISVAEQFELPGVLNELKPDIFHSPSFVAPLICPCKLVMTIHDMNHLAFPEYYSKVHQYYYKYVVKPSAIKSEKILTDSEFSKDEIIKFFKLSADKIVVTHLGIDHSFNDTDHQAKHQEVIQKYKLPEHFILYVGNRKPHKNVERLIEAYSRVNTDGKLAMSGDPDDNLNSLIIKLNLVDKVCFTGNIADSDLPVVYNLAELFVFPSLYEGFGLPPIEAMACGTPVITSNVSSLPEVVEDAAILVNPYDVSELANAITSVLSNEDTYQKLIEKGLAQAKKFTWEETANKTLAVYQEVFNNTKNR